MAPPIRMVNTWLLILYVSFLRGTVEEKFRCPETDILVKRQQDQCPGGIEIGVFKEGY